MYLPDAEAISEHRTASVRPDLRVVAARRTARRKFPRAWIATICCLTVAVLVMYVHTVVQEARLNRLKIEIDVMREATVRDRMQFEMVRNPKVIDDKARAALNMAPPKEVVFLAKPFDVKPAATTNIPLPQAVTHEGF